MRVALVDNNLNPKSNQKRVLRKRKAYFLKKDKPLNLNSRKIDLED